MVVLPHPHAPPHPRGVLEVRLVVIPSGGARSRDILRAGDWAWGGLDECALSKMCCVRGTLDLKGR